MIIIRVLRRAGKQGFCPSYRLPANPCTKRKISLIASGAALVAMTESTSPPYRFKEFVELCEKEGLLNRPAELTPEDTTDGINDETTLKYENLFSLINTPS
jgi:hypothetical protein